MDLIAKFGRARFGGFKWGWWRPPGPALFEIELSDATGRGVELRDGTTWAIALTDGTAYRPSAVDGTTRGIELQDGTTFGLELVSVE